MMLRTASIALSLAFAMPIEAAEPAKPAAITSVATPGFELLTTTLRDLGQKPRKIGDWKGKVLVVNFWATWCQPCRLEIPEFVEIQKAYQAKGVQFIGVAVDEPAPVKDFAKQYGINYPLLIGEEEAMEMMRTAGNKVGGLPFTVVVDRKGKIVASTAGKLPRAKLEAMLKQVLG